MVQRVEISYKTILFTVFFLISLWLLYQIKDTLFLIFLSVVAASALRVPVNILESYRIPRVLAIILTYIAVGLFIFLFLSYIIPVFIQQSARLLKELNYFFSFLGPYIDLSSENITGQLAPLSSNIYRVTVNIFSGVVSVFTFFALTFYLLLERRHMRVFLRTFLGEEMKEKVVDVSLKVEDRLGAWVRGQLSLMLIVGVFTYIGLSLLGVEYALPLAIIAGICEIIPIVGPVISAIPAIIVAWLTSPWLALATSALYFLIQQIENQVIVPMVMRRSVGMPPMVSIIAILIGSQLMGVFGGLMAIPFFVSIQVIVQETLFRNKQQN